jgi:hypothetical protein
VGLLDLEVLEDQADLAVRVVVCDPEVVCGGQAAYLRRTLVLQSLAQVRLRRVMLSSTCCSRLVDYMHHGPMSSVERTFRIESSIILPEVDVCGVP